ncbi:MAG TPA: VOC family protein [Thermoanaerobaculia bacterium]|nr:VOC family protein [Thermoanaerobaculia bacterium]
MTDAAAPPPGSIGWVDLTVADAEEVREFYRQVVGFDTMAVDMGTHKDWCVGPAGGDPVAGICHARGGNAGLAPVWLVYFVVADLDVSLASCRERGGEVLAPVRQMGKARYAVVRDPAGAACALYQAG